MIKIPLYTLLLLALCSITTANALEAEYAGMKFTGTGFLTAAVGKVLDGSPKGLSDAGYNCPCQISDYSHQSVYDNSSLNIAPDSKLGLQGRIDFTNKLSLTSQGVSRGSQNGRPDLEWLYASYKLTSDTTVQIGRKRLPLFYFSETQDVGLTYPWVHLPPQTYGWAVTNYNGINISHTHTLGSWSTTLNAYIGTETVINNPINKIYAKNDRSDDRWSNIMGAELFFSKGWFEGRLMAMTALAQSRIVSGSCVDTDSCTMDWGQKTRRNMYGFSTVITPNDWLLMTELLYTPVFNYDYSFAASASVGRHFGKWLPMVTYSIYEETILAPNAIDNERHSNTSVALRYDLTPASDVKLQFDHWLSYGGTSFPSIYGNSNMLTLAYDLVF
ncbi:MAG: hypothetical protein D0531_00765 [Methylococcales bacterium]|nr:MAG: hypothetical protein D0531_00765 [Methylococcales bacterium]